MTKVNISDTYPHLLLPVRSRHLFQLIWEGVVHQYRALWFGLAPAPRIFTKIMKAVVALLRPARCQCGIYLDDILILASSPAEFRWFTKMALDLMQHPCLLVTPSKVEAVPSQQI